MTEASERDGALVSPVPVEAMLRIHFMQQWFKLSDPAMEDVLHDVPLFRDFAGLGGWDDPLPDESTILRFCHLLAVRPREGALLGAQEERGPGANAVRV